MVSMSTHTARLLRECGFVEVPGDGFRFDLPGREKPTQYPMIVVGDEGYELSFPYRYPSFILNAYNDNIWHPTWRQVDEIFEQLAQHVLAHGNHMMDTAWYLYAYLAAPRVGNLDFTQSLDYYTDDDLLMLAKMRHLPPETFAQLIQHNVPVNVIQEFDISRSLGLLLDLYPEPGYRSAFDAKMVAGTQP